MFFISILTGNLNFKLKRRRSTISGGYIYFITAAEWLQDRAREKFENEMRRLQKEGKWRWVLMKESSDEFIEKDHTLTYAFKIL